MRRLSIRHLTRYLYDAEVSFGPHRLYLRPREGHDIRMVSSMLNIEPEHAVAWHRDVYGNSVATVEFLAPATSLAVLSEVVVEHYGEASVEIPLLEAYGETYPFQYDPQERPDLGPYQTPLFAKEGAALREWVAEFWAPSSVLPTFQLVGAINRAIPTRFGYLRREDPGVQRPSETIANGGGSCRDFATLFIETCRHIGLAARFVSGYLHAPGLPAAEGATHAWGEVYLPGAGWLGFDSTTGGPVGHDHIAVAVSRHPETVPPVSGTFAGQTSAPPAMDVAVEVALA